MKKYLIPFLMLSTIVAKGANQPIIISNKFPRVSFDYDKELKKIKNPIQQNYFTYSNTRLYRQPFSYDLSDKDAIELNAYNNFIRAINEENRLTNGKNYFVKNEYNVEEISDIPELVPVISAGILGNRTFTNKENSSFSLKDIVNNPTEISKDPIKSNISYTKNGNVKRFFFGNNNTLKNISFENSKNFKKSIEDAKEDKNFGYLIEGFYQPVFIKNTFYHTEETAKSINPLEISLDEYQKNIYGKNPNSKEVLHYLQKKLKDKNLETVVEKDKNDNYEIYTVDSKNRKHRLLWSLEAVSIPSNVDFKNEDSPRRYINTILSSFYKWVPLNDGEDILLTKSKDIIIKNQNSNNELSFKIMPENLVNTAVKENDDFDVRIFNLPKYEEGKKLFNNLESTSTLMAAIKDNPNYTSLEDLNLESGTNIKNIFKYYFEDLKEVKTGVVPSPKNKLKKIPMTKEEFDKKWDIIITLTDYFKDLKKVNDGTLATKDFKAKWENKKIDSEFLTATIPSKKVEFRGRGVITGIVDLGPGVNTLTVSQQSTGKYGTNIVFAPTAQLKNINTIEVDGQSGDRGAAGISGKTSFSIQVDPNEKDSNGRLYKSVLRGTWDPNNKIIFRKDTIFEKELNDFGVELQVSKFNKDIEFDVGRPLKYMGIKKTSTSEGASDSLFKYNLDIYSDSIAHRIDDVKNELDKNAIVKITIKDNLKRLSPSENTVYKSIKDSASIGTLSPTLSSSSKKTFFSGEEDLLRDKYKQELVINIHEGKNPEEIIDKLGHFYLNESNKQNIIKIIEKLSSNKEVNKVQQEIKSLRKFYASNIDLSPVIKIQNDIFTNEINTKDFNNFIDTETDTYFKKIQDFREKKEKLITSTSQKFNEMLKSDTSDEETKAELTKIFNEKLNDGIVSLYDNFLKENQFENDENYKLNVNFNVDKNKINSISKEDLKNNIKKYYMLSLFNSNNADIYSKSLTTKEKQEKIKEIKTEIKKYENILKNINANLNDNTNNNSLLKQIRKNIAVLLKTLDTENNNELNLPILYSSLGNLKSSINHFKETTLKDKENEINKQLLMDLQRTPEFSKLLTELFYTQREEESLKELKTLLSQLQNKNIYAKINKLSKNEIDVLTPLPFNIKYDFTNKNGFATGGALSGRYSNKEFKTTMYTGYGIYEKSINDKTTFGLMIAGGSSTNNEIKNDTLREVTTTSKITGNRVYLGGYTRHFIMPNLYVIGGIGGQYSKYNVDRDFKNNYQEERYKGKVNTTTFAAYTGAKYTYKINDTININTKAVISYTLVNQGKVKEEEKPLALEVNAQKFSYLDGEIGADITKTIYSENSKSSISGGAYIVQGLAGYNNKNLKGKIKNSSSSFNIDGQKYDKTSVKVFLDYNVYLNSGLNYGIEGSYTTNDKENNISVGIKAGYKF